MKVLVTGAVGNVGRATVELLAADGHSIRIVGRRSGLHVAGAEYHACDVINYPRLVELTRGMDAVVHLAAMGNPSLGTPEQVFRTNCQGTFNVYQAAVEAGVRRVVAASSINSLGLGFSTRESRITCVPIDEDHPTFTSDAYSFSKNVVEEITAYFDRREGISGVAMRLPAVVPVKHYSGESARDMIARRRESFDALCAMSEDERSAIIGKWMAQLSKIRANRLLEGPAEARTGVFPNDPIVAGLTDLWTAVDERDSARAISLAVTGDYSGSHTLFINDRVNITGIPSQELMEMFYPDVTVAHPIGRYETLVSIDRARDIIGYEPEFSLDRYY